MPSAASQPDVTPEPHAHETVHDGCTYCGLPVAATDDSDAPVYCCYGCRFAHAVVREQGDEGAIRWTVIRLGLAIFFTMNLMAFTMTMWSLDVYEVEPDPFQLTLFEVFRWLSMLLALPVLLLLGVPLLQNAFENWRRQVYSTDLLIGLAVIAAYVTSVVNVIRESGAIYFEVGATVLVMITLGRWIEAAGKQKATEALDNLLTLLPATVEHVGRYNPAVKVPEPLLPLSPEHNLSDSINETPVGAVPEIPATLIQPTSISAADICIDDLLHIRAGERFPTDAVIHSGSTTVDEQVFTGESQPVTKLAGDPVLAGTVNLDGDIVVQVTAGFKLGSFGRLLQTLQDARTASGYYQRLADKVAARFFPLITVIAICTFLWHYPAGISVAIHAAMSVLLIACPCALGLATPLAVWTALSTAVKHQVLFRSGEALERLANTKAVCFDKTGTLTTGSPHVFQTAFFGDDRNEASTLALAGQLADSSTHPFSQAVASYVAESCRPDQTLHLLRPMPASIRTVAGGGVEATIPDGQLVRLGSVEFSCCKLHDGQTNAENSAPDLCVACKATVSLSLRIQLDRLRMAADQQAASIVLLSVNSVPAVGFLISESIRLEAQRALQQLSEETESLHVLSGDRPSKGRFLQEQLHVKGLNVECSLNPQQKVARVTEVHRIFGTTVMVGDGINDAPALAASDVGIAMGCGADVSRDSAQVCLLSNDLTQITWAIKLARRTTSVIRQNLFWAFGYNTVGVCLAATGILNPAIAAGLMIASSLLVISNSLRLLKDDSPDGDSSDSMGQHSQDAGDQLVAKGLTSAVEPSAATVDLTTEVGP